MTAFGEALRTFRNASNDPHRLKRRLSQARLGRLIGEELGDLGFTGAAVAYWESGESKISAEDRNVLLALTKVLHQCGGLKTLAEANHFLELGNYRALKDDEASIIFVASSRAANPEQEGSPRTSIPFLIENLLAVSEKEFKAIIDKAKEDGPEPWWPRALAALMRKAADRFSLSVRTVLWVWVWLIAWWLMAPSLRLSFVYPDAILPATQKYVIGTLVIPLLIGLLVNTKNNEYWKQHPAVNPILLRIYTYQGAGIGFNLGYFFLFPISLAIYYLQLGPSVWVEIAAVTAGLILGNMGARVVPHNLWVAYKRLNLSDGAIFFFVALLGPLWGFFFLEFYPILLHPITGAIVILLAVTIIVILTTRQLKNYDK